MADEQEEIKEPETNPVNHLNVDDLDRRLKLVEAKVFGEKEPEQSNG